MSAPVLAHLTTTDMSLELLLGPQLEAFAAAVLGFVVALERRASGGILAPILTHITWSVTMAFTLPGLLG